MRQRVICIRNVGHQNYSEYPDLGHQYTALSSSDSRIIFGQLRRYIGTNYRTNRRLDMAAEIVRVGRFYFAGITRFMIGDGLS